MCSLLQPNRFRQGHRPLLGGQKNPDTFVPGFLLSVILDTVRSLVLRTGVQNLFA